MTKRYRGVALAALMLSACSGGSNSGSSGPQNQAPSFSTPPVNVSAPENERDVLVTVFASDPDGDALSYALTGEDRAAFDFDETSLQLRFASAPDFEAPGDADGNNQYVAGIRASDPGGLSDTLSVTVDVTNVAEPGDPVRYRDLVFSNVTSEDGVAFASVGGETLRLTIYSPAGDTASDRPVLLVASGGGFVEQERASVEPIAEDFARRGYVAATMDYRTLGTDPADADDLAVAGATATHDMFAAVRFLRAEGEAGNLRGINPDAIFVSGESAGAVMAMLAASLDPADTISRPALADFLAANGGVYGTVGDNDATPSVVQGAMPLSGAVFDPAAVDDGSAVLYAAHEEFDPVVPCGTAPEGASFTGLVISGACDIVPAYETAGVTARLFLVAGSTGHVEFTAAQRRDIYQGAAELFFDTVISPPE